MCSGDGNLYHTATVGTVSLATTNSPPPSPSATDHQLQPSPPTTPHLQPRKQQQKKTKPPGVEKSEEPSGPSTQYSINLNRKKRQIIYINIHLMLYMFGSLSL